MTKNLNFHVAIMLVAALVINYLFINQVTSSDGVAAYDFGYILGRSFSNVLFPLLLVFLVMLPFRWGKAKFTRGPLIALWILFVILTAMATIGSMLPSNV